MTSHLQLVNRLNEVIVANLSVIGAWGFYLTSDEFNGEMELRNRLSVIWICSLIDTIEAETRFLPEVANEASELGYGSIVQNVAELQKFCGVIGEILSLYTREEQIFLTDLRNQWVHSYFANRHKDHVTIKYYEDGQIHNSAIDGGEYRRIVRTFFERNRYLDPTLRRLVKRAFRTSRLKYWKILGRLQEDRDLIYQTMRNDQVISAWFHDC